MAKVKHETIVEFDDGNIYVLWYSDDDEGYGVELIGEDGIGGDTTGIRDWSFGHDREACDLSSDWFDYVVDELREKGPELSKEIDLYCVYQPDELEEHLEDLDKIKELLKKKVDSN